MLGIPYCANGWDEIVPGLYVGGHDRAHPDNDRYPLPVIVDDQFDLVISLYHRDGYGPTSEHVQHVEHLIPDGPLSTPDLLDTLADQAAAAVRDGRKVLVRCQAGLNRSSLIAALALLRLGHTDEQAIDLIRQRRHGLALHNEHFVQHIKETYRVNP